QGAQLLSVAIGPLVGGVIASHLGTRAAFFVTAGMCSLALVALIILFQEKRPIGPDERRAAARSTSFAAFLRDPNFIAVMALLVIAQFVDRGLGLLIPLHVAHLPGVEAIAATSGFIISVSAVGAAASAAAVARLSQAFPAGQILLAQFLAGGLVCGALAFVNHWVAILVLRTVLALCVGGALTLAYSLGGMIVPGETRGAAFG